MTAQKPPSVDKRWFQDRVSEFPWEQAGLDHVRSLMPNVEPYRAWATFTFTATSGRIHECDLLVAAPAGLFLIELKAHPGRVVNSGDTWMFRDPDSGRVLTLRNPLHLTDSKSKDLKAQLRWAAGQIGYKGRIPRVEPIVFLTAPNLRSQLDEVQRIRVYGRDDVDTGLPRIWNDLLNAPPHRQSQRVDAEFSRTLQKLLHRIGIRTATAHLRFDDEWLIKKDVLDQGPTWQDRLASRVGGVLKEEGRVRIYQTAPNATPEQRAAVSRAARREYAVLQGIAHRGIAQAVDCRELEAGTAILFRHRHTDLRLDDYLATYREQLTPETRLDLLRQLAESVRYAHSRHLYHRALAARSVYVSARDGRDPVLRIIDWQAAARDLEMTGHSSLGRDPLTGQHVEDAAQIYLAPEFNQPYADPVTLDVFGLGAIAYLILTGLPPADQPAELRERLSRDGGLRPSAVVDGLPEALDELVFTATQGRWEDRYVSADAVLDALDEVERQLAAPEPAAPAPDPLTAVPGHVLDGAWEVERVLGTGATARALLVKCERELDDGQIRVDRRVFKVALDEGKAARLRAESEALAKVGGGVIVQRLGGPRQISGRTVLELEYAFGDDLAGRTLGALLRDEGRLTYHQLERFGADLFAALDQLAGKGVRHRDLKPDNFGVYRRADRSLQLMLFDFSLAGVSERDISAGTRGYLDPFLGTARRPHFDDHAEWYAAAVTLHEMASNEQPEWGDGATAPDVLDDELPQIKAEAFEPVLRDGLVAFFQRALHRDVNRRFDTRKEMEEAWRAIFRQAEQTGPASTPDTDHGLDDASVEEQREIAAEAATLDTPLVAAGLTAKAQSVAAAFGAQTVRELLDVPLYRIAKARGAGLAVRRELNRRHKQWTAKLARTPVPAMPSGGETVTLDSLIALLVPASVRRGSKRVDVVRGLLGLPADDGAKPALWPTQAEVAEKLAINQATVSQHYQRALAEWAAQPVLCDLRAELVALLEARGRVATATELAAELRARYGSNDEVLGKALAVVRAMVDTEFWLGKQPDGGDPKMAMHRRGTHIVIALESLTDGSDPSGVELAGYAARLGERADELVRSEPLPGSQAVVRELRAVPPPEGMPPLADTRLVGLAAAMSQQAASSPRLELYPRDIGLVRALRLSQAAAGVRRAPGITVPELLHRVRARFPEITLPGTPTYLELEDALREADFRLEYDPATQRFVPSAPERPRLSSSLSVTGGPTWAGLEPHEVVARRLDDAIRHGGFVALTLRGLYLPGTAAALAARYPVAAVNFDALFLAEFRALAAETGTPWDKVLSTDARFTERQQLSPGLRSYLEGTWRRVERRLLERADERTVLFVHDAGLLGHYIHGGGRELLVRLQAAARVPDRRPHGLWLLCPADSAGDSPRLGDQIVEVTQESEKVVLHPRFLDWLKSSATAA